MAYLFGPGVDGVTGLRCMRRKAYGVRHKVGGVRYIAKGFEVAKIPIVP